MAGQADFLNILREIRGTGVPGEVYTDGIWHELTIELKNGNPGIYGDILAKYGVILTETDNLETILAEVQNLKDQAFASQTAAALSESNTTDSELNAATSASEASDSAVAAEVSRVAAIAAETNANNSATVADVSKTTAVNAANSATASAASANTDKLNAANSATSAATKADEAAASAASIGDAETNSASSAGAALVSENAAQLRAWEAEAEKLTANSYAVEAQDTPVNIVTSNGDGTFTYTPTSPPEYSAFHWRTKAQSLVSGGLANFSRYGVVTGLEVTINGVDDTTYDIATGEYYINDVLYTYPGSTGNPTGLLAGQTLLTIGLDSSLNIVVVKGDSFTDDQRLVTIEIGALATLGGATQIQRIDESIFRATNVLARLHVRTKNYGETVFDAVAGKLSESSTPLQLDIAGGTLNDAEMDSKTISFASDVGGVEILHNGSGDWITNSVATHIIDTTQYDNGAGLVAATAGRFLAIDVARSSRTGTVYITRPQGEHITFSEALNSTYSANDIFMSKGLDVVPIGRIIVKTNDTSIRHIEDYRNVIPKARVPKVVTDGTNNLSSFGNGSIIDTVSTDIESDGVTVTFTYQDPNNSHLTCQFDEQSFFLANGSISLTAGSDTSPTRNFVYVELVGGVPRASVSTAKFPTTAHCPLAEVLVPSALTVQSEGVYTYQSWVNHMSDVNGLGHLYDINYWIRQQGAIYVSGIETSTTPSVGGGEVVNGVNATITAGELLQLHKYAADALNISVDGARIINHPVTPFLKVTNLDVLVDANNISMANERYNLVLLVCVNEDGTKAYINLPNGTYATDEEAINDSSNLSNYSIPAEFAGKTIVAARVTIRHRTISGGAYEVLNITSDVRNMTGGGSATLKDVYADNEFKLYDEIDPTKEMQFQLSGISAGTARTIEIPDKDGIIALESDFDTIIEW